MGGMELILCLKGALLVWVSCLWVPMVVVGQSANHSSAARPKEVKVGALFTLNSYIGRSAKPALLAAVDEINSDPSILKGTKLKLILHDTNCSGFLGTVEGNSGSEDGNSCLN